MLMIILLVGSTQIFVDRISPVISWSKFCISSFPLGKGCQNFDQIGFLAEGLTFPKGWTSQVDGIPYWHECEWKNLWKSPVPWRLSVRWPWNMGGTPKIGLGPQNGWFIMENPFKIDDLGVLLFLDTPYWLSCRESEQVYNFECDLLPRKKKLPSSCTEKTHATSIVVQSKLAHKFSCRELNHPDWWFHFS